MAADLPGKIIVIGNVHILGTVKGTLQYSIGKKQNREDHRFTSNLLGLMMMLVENIP